MEQTGSPPCPDLVQIDALIHALDNLRHWTSDARDKGRRRDLQGRRLALSAARLRDESWSASLLAAYQLFEVDGLHQAWRDIGGGHA
ncbi:MAG: hypothetical protein ACOY5R_21820 [Pseudomonadota bacterium]